MIVERGGEVNPIFYQIQEKKKPEMEIICVSAMLCDICVLFGHHIHCRILGEYFSTLICDHEIYTVNPHRHLNGRIYEFLVN